MSKKISSMLVTLLIYLAAIAIGVVSFIYVLPDLDLVYRVLIADLIATVFIWLVSLPLKNASLYDPYWSVIPPIIVLLLMFYTNNWGLSLILLLLALSVWAIRLTYNWGKLWTDFSHVDWRYNNFQVMAPKLYWLVSFLAIMFVPTMIVFFQLIGPIILVEQVNLSFGLASILGTVVIVLSALLQLSADTQMQNFKKDPQNKGEIMKAGLWKYSRHPNYLGEIMVWWGTYLFYVQQFGFDWIILAPIAMTALFVFISVPLMEKKILKTRPEYSDYIKEGGMLVPFPKQMFSKSSVNQEK